MNCFWSEATVQPVEKHINDLTVILEHSGVNCLKDFSDKLLEFSLILFIFTVMVITTSNVSQVLASGNDDANTKEIIIEWIKNYTLNPGFDDLSNTQADAEGFYNKLLSNSVSNFTGKGNYGNFNAKEIHFENASVGGKDFSYVDTVDFVYFAGHGTNVSINFGNNTDGGGGYTWQVHCTEADWGDNDTEWLFLAACSELEGGFPTRWNPAFHSPITLHGIAGFNTTAEDSADLGKYFATYMLGGYSIYESWKMATEDAQPPSRWAATYSVVMTCVGQPTIHWRDEHIPGVGDGMYSDPPVPQPGLTIWFEYSSWHC